MCFSPISGPKNSFVVLQVCSLLVPFWEQSNLWLTFLYSLAKVTDCCLESGLHSVTWGKGSCRHASAPIWVGSNSYYIAVSRGIEQIWWLNSSLWGRVTLSHSSGCGSCGTSADMAYSSWGFGELVSALLNMGHYQCLPAWEEFEYAPQIFAHSSGLLWVRDTGPVTAVSHPKWDSCASPKSDMLLFQLPSGN
jgi:hypothetical protein